MKSKLNQRSDRGITLVALIITIIILVILAAVSISAVYNSKMVEYAVNGATEYAEEMIKENAVMSGTESLIDSTVKKIEDILGGKIPSEGEGQPNPPTPEEQKGLTADQLKEKVGAYVGYKPSDTNPSSYSTTQEGAERSGNDGGEQTINKDNNLTWRILSVDGSKVTLIATEPATGTLKLEGANGYNNGVKLLNDACSTLYSNSTLGAMARSVDVDDINSLMGVTPSTSLDSSYGTEYTPSNKHYPKIFQYEKTGYVNSGYGTSLGLSEQTSWYDGYAQATTLKGKYTYYNYTLSTYKATSTIQHALATCGDASTGSTSHTTYWLASRCVAISSTGADFRMFRVRSGSVNADWLFSSDNNTYSPSYAVRPVIEIDLNKVNIGETGTGADTANAYSIAVK